VTSKIKALKLLNANLQNDLAVARSNLTDASRMIKGNHKKLDNQLDAKHQHWLSLAKIV
jgi:hypothetical protein